MAPVLRHRDYQSERTHEPGPFKDARYPPPSRLRPMAGQGTNRTAPVDLLRPLDSDEMEMFETNPKVGNVRNNGPELMRAAVAAAECAGRPQDGKDER